jgi:hypothetical protein
MNLQLPRLLSSNRSPLLATGWHKASQSHEPWSPIQNVIQPFKTFQHTGETNNTLRVRSRWCFDTDPPLICVASSVTYRDSKFAENVEFPLLSLNNKVRLETVSNRTKLQLNRTVNKRDISIYPVITHPPKTLKTQKSQKTHMRLDGGKIIFG